MIEIGLLPLASADRAGGGRQAEPAGEFAIADRLAERDLEQRAPDTPAERGRSVEVSGTSNSVRSPAK